MARLNLFERLGMPVAPLGCGGPTRITEADVETFDDDPDLASAGVPHAMDLGTSVTFVDSETYDDAGLGMLANPLDDSTYFTKVADETYDDDPGIGRLAFPGT